MEKPKKNLEESIYSRLKNVAKQRKRPVQEVLKYYAMERFLYRLRVSSHQSSFYLKGGGDVDGLGSNEPSGNGGHRSFS